MLTARPANILDAEHMAPRLRPADVDEVWAASGSSPMVALTRGLYYSVSPIVGVDAQDLPVCMGGVVPSGDPLVGLIWMLGTTDIESHRLSFLRRSRPWVEQWNGEFPLLTNVVDERNQLHIRWLRWLGFTFIARHPRYGFERRPFLEFVRTPHV